MCKNLKIGVGVGVGAGVGVGVGVGHNTNPNPNPKIKVWLNNRTEKTVCEYFNKLSLFISYQKK